MRKHFIFCFLLFILAKNISFAQTQNPDAPQNTIVFEKLEHNFGVIKEENGKASYNFEFTNTGKTPIKLTNVQASCGCTTPNWTKEEILPKKTGIVTAIYDTKDRPGVFNKSITVTVGTAGTPQVEQPLPNTKNTVNKLDKNKAQPDNLNKTASITTTGTSQTIVLIIKGEVIPRSKGIVDFYPYEKGSLRFSMANVYFDKVFHDQPAQYKTLVMYNQSEKDIKLNIDMMYAKLGAPYITFKKPATDIVKAKDSLKLEVGFDATKQKDWDYMGSWLNIETDDTKETNGVKETTKQIYVGGNVVENFGNMTKDAKIPSAKFDRTTHDFGKIQVGKQHKTQFTITNKGDAPLIIRQVKATCGCTAGKPTKNTLYPGESTQFDATFSSVGKQPGKQNQEITIITNDPAMPRQVLKLDMEIVN